MITFNKFIPTRILFGSGMLSKLHEQTMPGEKALLVISDGKSTRVNGYLDRVEKELKLAGIKIVLFDKIKANPLKSVVMEGANVAREQECDFVIALGGGSVMDAAKLIAMMAKNSGDLWDYVFSGTGKGQTPIGGNLPIICITTTAGTGSEVDPWGVITNNETHEKIGCGGLATMFPVFCIVDPELMLSVPPKFTAYQGFDALFHSIECYISKAANLMSDMYALTAIENIAKYLPCAVKNGNDIESREHVAFANNLSGAVMTISVCTSEHSIEHAMSAIHEDLPHGAGLIMISKAYYEYFINKHVCDERFIKMAQVMGMKDAKKPEDFISMLAKLQKDCGVEQLKMSDYGINPGEFSEIAIKAKETMGKLFVFDPCEMSHEDCKKILDKSYQ